MWGYKALCFVNQSIHNLTIKTLVLANYPRTLEADAELLASVGCQFVFCS